MVSGGGGTAQALGNSGDASCASRLASSAASPTILAGVCPCVLCRARCFLGATGPRARCFLPCSRWCILRMQSTHAMRRGPCTPRLWSCKPRAPRRDIASAHGSQAWGVRRVETDGAQRKGASGCKKASVASAKREHA